MSLLGIALGVAEDTEFDPNQVTPGVEGFIFTGLMAALIIGLGFLLVSRLRRNAYRHEVRDQIASELAGPDGGTPEGAAGTEAGAGTEQRN
ncbi:hypothetical protein EDF62_3133 [Leucobacter luti]|uniref:Uncharacterized protein n=1 Tax=Leucobacter luti TaxID=340320 RepID=A0A4R6RU91_9MICO|nr:hypothetical protein [Leucobacter luti]TDP89835.1 hypothetical protein EDF62_3133 [Leucobacter luti]